MKLSSFANFLALTIILCLIPLGATKHINFQSFGKNSSDLSSIFKYSSIKGRVFGGREANKHGAPYIVSIQIESSSSGKPGTHICGGTILNENWIVTAAHCLQSSSQIKNLIIVAGAHDIDKLESDIQIRKVDFYKNHELYNGGINPYDIALIYTKEEFNLNSNVKSVKLPSKDSMPTGNANLYGWGSTSPADPPRYPGKLQFADMPIIDNDLCKKSLGEQGYKVHNTNLCTGPLDGATSICRADSGGPLVQSDKLIGVVSWGPVPCGQPDLPSVFVRVSAFIDWIEKNQSQM